MGDSYRTGNGVEKDAAKSGEYFKKACAMGSDYACKTLKDSKVPRRLDTIAIER